MRISRNKILSNSVRISRNKILSINLSEYGVYSRYIVAYKFFFKEMLLTNVPWLSDCAMRGISMLSISPRLALVLSMLTQGVFNPCLNVKT